MAGVHMLTTADENIAGYSGADFRRLFAAAQCDRFRQHRLVGSPDIADIILFVGSSYVDHRDVRAHPLLRRYGDKCFLFYSEDYVIPFLRGVYVNIPKRWHTDRTIAGPYLQMTQWDYVPYVPSLAGCEYLFSFVGSAKTHPVRRHLMNLKHPRAYVENTSHDVTKDEKNKAFFMVDYKQDAKSRYGEIISKSKFVLCPRGYACSTWRLFETMKAGRVPVILSDQWVPPPGPVWERFSIRVKENQTNTIPALLERYESQAQTMGKSARAAWEEWFSNETVFHRIVDYCLTLKQRPQSVTADMLPFVQLLRPFFLRHVLLPDIKRVLLQNVGGLRRLLVRFF